MKQILLVEDETVIAYGLIYAFEREGYAVTHGKDVGEAKTIISDNTFDLAVIDMRLPDGNGFEVRERLKGTSTAIIFLTVEDDEGTMVSAFEDGADDYITKPFRLRELLARVKRTLNQHEGKASSLLTIGNVVIDQTAGKVFVDQTLIELTTLEYRLLLIFAYHKGQMLTRTQILDSIWDSAGNYVEDNTLTVYIKRLREKLEGAIHIETVRGIGYRAD